MVCEMGLLDDAIREHLELKRRRGADPGEVAREQREALAPVAAGGQASAEGEGESREEHAADEPVEPAAHGVAIDEHPTQAHEQLPPSPGEATHGVQETAEIDMQRVLDEGGDVPTAGTAEGHDAMSAPPAIQADEELEWETPSRGAVHDEVDEHSEPPREIPGQERMPFE
jgi:hypothetical protein